jgi:hypothetical protein
MVRWRVDEGCEDDDGWRKMAAAGRIGGTATPKVSAMFAGSISRRGRYEAKVESGKSNVREMLRCQ